MPDIPYYILLLRLAFEARLLDAQRHGIIPWFGAGASECRKLRQARKQSLEILVLCKRQPIYSCILPHVQQELSQTKSRVMLGSGSHT